MEERIEALRTQLKQVQGTKTRLEHQMDEWNSRLLVESDSDMFPRTDRCLKPVDMFLKSIERTIERTDKTSIYSYGD